MTIAFVLLNTDAGVENQALRRMKAVTGVTEAYVTYGLYDIIAKVEADSQQKVKEIIFSKIRGIDEVKSTLTLVVAE